MKKMVESENRTIRFNNQMFLKHFAIFSFILAAVNIAAAAYQVFHIYQNNILIEDLVKKINTASVFFILIGTSLSCIVLVASVWAMELEQHRLKRARSNLNNYCCLTCTLTTMQLVVHTFDGLLVSFKPYTFYTSLYTALTSYVIVLRYYVMCDDVKNNRSRKKLSFHSSRYIYTSQSCLYPNVEELLDLVRSNREDNIPTYKDLILQDLRKKVEEDEVSFPPRYEDIV